MKVSFRLFFILIALLLCSCEKDGVSPDPRVGAFHYNGIYIGKTEGAPAVAGAGSTDKVVLIHQFDARLYYYVGTVNVGNETVSWGGNTAWPASAVSDVALDPSVSISENNIVAAAFQTGDYQGQPTGHIYAAIGTINGNSINWLGFSYVNIPGYYPTITITRDGKYVILVYQNSATGGTLSYSVSPVMTGANGINFGAPISFDAGCLPSIAMNNANQIILVHASYQSNNGIWYKLGTFNEQTQTINWGGTISYNSSDKSLGGPKVGINDPELGTSFIVTIFPSPSDRGYYCFQTADLDSFNTIGWDPMYQNNLWVDDASVSRVYMGRAVEVYLDGNDPENMYYFIGY